MVAEVIINSNVKTLNKTFDYEVPSNLEIKLGARVFVPFGRKKELEEGIVVGFKDKSEFEVKEIAGLQEEQIEEDYIDLAKWISERYFCNFSESLNLMLPPGRVTKNTENRIKEKTINCLKLAKTNEEIRADIESGLIKKERHIDALEYLMNNEKVTIQELEMFTDATAAIVKTLVKNGYIEKEEEHVERNPFLHKDIVKSVDLKLNKEQEIAYKSIKDNGEYLLYGITGSGKTEIYLQLIEKMLAKGKSSIMLVPEISLTPQTVDRFISRFGSDKIAVLHSKLSTGERYDQWQKINRGDAQIVIGARSAIFAPVKNLGLILIDEEHDESYQSEKSPRYDAIEVAEFIRNKKDICLVLGSATPHMKDYYKTQKGEIELLKLTKRATEATLPDVEIIDLRNELIHGNKTMISDRLREEIENNLKNKKQTILFLNRRGFSSFLMCRECGFTLRCKRCDIAMTYHKNDNMLKCHYCGYEVKVPHECPKCKSTNIRYFGAGTQKLEEDVLKLFPDASTIRMDVDTIGKKNSHEDILNKFKKENIDILIGTQMVVKGHHFPKVTLVGVIAADSDLNIGDYRAAERTFQTITQVAGRAGREKDKGKVIVQTYNPDHYAIEFAKEQDYELFYDTELEIRKQLKYPPFCDIIVIDMSATDLSKLKSISKKIHGYLKDRVINEKFGLLLYSPVSSPIAKIKDRYRMRMLIKCLYDDRINELLNSSLKEFYNMKQTDVRMNIQINPNNML